MKTLRLCLALLCIAAMTGCATPQTSSRGATDEPRPRSERRSVGDQLCDQTLQLLLNLAVNSCIRAF